LPKKALWNFYFFGAFSFFGYGLGVDKFFIVVKFSSDISKTAVVLTKA